MCRRGFSDTQEVLKNIQDENLRAYIIWLPILRSDDRPSAVKRSGEYYDKRLSYFWDGKQITGRTWQRVLDIPRIAWDIYFLYDSNVRWAKEPSQPNFWMHQLGGVSEGKRLDAKEFELKVKELLRKIE